MVVDLDRLNFTNNKLSFTSISTKQIIGQTGKVEMIDVTMWYDHKLQYNSLTTVEIHVIMQKCRMNCTH